MVRYRGVQYWFLFLSASLYHQRSQPFEVQDDPLLILNIFYRQQYPQNRVTFEQLLRNILQSIHFQLALYIVLKVLKHFKAPRYNAIELNFVVFMPLRNYRSPLRGLRQLMSNLAADTKADADVRIFHSTITSILNYAHKYNKLLH